MGRKDGTIGEGFWRFLLLGPEFLGFTLLFWCLLVTNTFYFSRSLKYSLTLVNHFYLYSSTCITTVKIKKIINR